MHMFASIANLLRVLKRSYLSASEPGYVLAHCGSIKVTLDNRAFKKPDHDHGTTRSGMHRRFVGIRSRTINVTRPLAGVEQQQIARDT